MKNKRVVAAISLTAALLLFVSPLATVPAHAESAGTNGSRDTVYYLGESVNTGLDNGFSESNPIKESDPHFGWELGRFYVSGFTSKKGDETPVFLKNVGDQVALYFNLEQNIDALNDDASLTIANDGNGYDESFGVPKTDFGRGTLIIKHIDYQNASTDPQIYYDYLSGVTMGANTQVDLFEEGDYEVALDYEIQSPGFLNNPVLRTYNDYRITFKFKVRNSNTMAFLFDSDTGNELYNGSVTPNGFKIDLAGSHYLDVAIKKEVLNDTGDGIVEDTRFNRSAADGDIFTDDGIYTVTVSNPTTGEEPTVKKIYVGTDDVLKAVVANSLDITEVQNQLNQGAKVAEDGTLTASSPETNSATTESNGADEEASTSNELEFSNGIILVILAILLAFLIIRHKRKTTDTQPPKASNSNDNDRADGDTK
jgi:hypothetical protein